MHIQKALENQVQLLISLLEEITPEIYTYSCKALSGSTIGQHTRHATECLQCLMDGYESGFVNYDTRQRDLNLENDKTFAVNALKQILEQIDKKDKLLGFEGSYSLDGENFHITSNYYRELAYHVEHFVHHLALIKVAILVRDEDYSFPDGFGVAYSTQAYRTSDLPSFS